LIRFLGWTIVGFVGVVIVVNPSVMLVSPRTWFRLPGWLRAQGTLTERQYGRGWGAVQLRIGGCVVLASIGWIVFDMLR
jgi:hypothetical protein